jgi:MYXO-CTERM domain-containing protein
MSKKLLILALLTTTLSLSSIAFACSLEGHQELGLDETLPAIIFEEFEATVDGIQRGANTGSSCDDLGSVAIKITEVDPEVGYTVELVEGNAPKNLGQHLKPVIPNSGGRLVLVWSDEISDEQPPVDFTLRVTAIAPNGDLGPSHEVVVSDPGSDGGCSATGHQDASLLGLLMFGLLFQWRRKG